LAVNRENSINDLRLVFSAIGEDDAADIGSTAYELRLLEPSGATAMRFTLPADTVEPVVLSQTDMLISMTPDGAVTACTDSDADRPSTEPIAIDELVKRAVTPRMLDDEPDVGGMLQTFRDRLRHALEIVETAMARLR
jgi:hypothetical protein